MKISVFFGIFFLTALTVVGQNLLTGNIKDVKTGEALPYASIKLKNKPGGAYTDQNGFFKINAVAGDSVQVTFVGYIDLHTILQEKNTISIEPQTKLLRAVVVKPQKSEEVICGIKVGTLIERGSWKVKSGFTMVTKIDLPDTVSSYYLNTAYFNMDGKLSRGEKLQLHVFDVLNDSVPGKELLSEPVYLDRDYKLSTGIPLTRLNIILSKAVFIGLEVVGETDKVTIISAFPKINFVEKSRIVTYARDLQDSVYQWKPVVFRTEFSMHNTIEMIVSVSVEKIE